MPWIFLLKQMKVPEGIGIKDNSISTAAFPYKYGFFNAF